MTEGHAPTPDSTWKVIQSIEGGCPKADVAGNLEPGENPDTYTFTIPDDFEPGNYTWAWTWVNKIAASPEFYMNCAPISVTAAAGSTKRVKDRRRRREQKKHFSSRQEATSYPDLFLANIGSASNGCTTSEAVEQQIAIAFPYPGSAISYPNGQENLFAQACDGNPRNNNNNDGGSASGSSSGGAQPFASGGGMMSIYPIGTTLGSATSSTVVPGATTTTSSSTSEAAATTTSSVPVAYSSSELVTTASSSFSTIVTSSATAPSSATSTGTSTLGDSCTDGHLLCVGGTQFSTCTGGVWDAPQDLAAHTTCEGGEGVGLTVINHY